MDGRQTQRGLATTMRVVAGLILVSVVAACGRDRAPESSNYQFLPAAEDLASLGEKPAEILRRFRSRFLEGGQVVSRRGDVPEHLGDALIWSGVALAALSCEEGQVVEDALAAMTNRYGTFVRFSPLPAKYMGNEVSPDGVIGVTYGLASRLRRCPERRAAITAIWRQHREFVAAHGGQLYPGAQYGTLVDGLNTPGELLAHQLDFRSSVHSDGLTALDTVVVGWAFFTVQKRVSCYRIHIGLLAWLAADVLGAPPSESAKARLCRVTDKSGQALADFVCARLSGKMFLEAYQLNQWEYAAQRCTAWESPDGQEGLETPALDYLLIHHLARRA